MALNKNIIKYSFICLIYIFYTATVVYSDIASYNGVSIIEIPDFSIKSNSLDYCVRRLKFINSNQQEHKIDICLENSDRSIKKSIILQGGETKTECVYGPCYESYNRFSLCVYIDGQKIDYSFSKVTTNYGRDYSILVDPNLSSNLFEDFMLTKEENKTDKKTGSSTSPKDFKYRDSIEKFAGSLEQFPSLWQAYWVFNAVVLSSDSLLGLDYKIKEAVFDYVRMGGYLVVFGKLAKYPVDIILKSNKEVCRTSELGLGYITEIKLDVNDEESLNVHSWAFKQKYKIAAFEVSEYILSRRGNMPIMKFKDSELLVYDEALLSCVTLFFALILGPINFIYLYKKRKQILVFITVPVLSILLCLFVVFYYQFFESKFLNIKKNSFIMLDENTNKAMILSNYALYSAKSRNNCLEFPNSAAVFPSDKGSYSYYDLGFGSIEIDSMQRFTKNWIHAKNIEEFKIYDIENVRDRIEFSGENDIRVLNGLSGDISKLVYKDYFGRLYTSTGEIKVGNSATLTGKESQTNSSDDIVSRLYYEFYCRDEVCKDLAKSPELYLKPGQYYVEMQSSSFLKQKLEEQAQVSEITYLIGTRKREG